MPQLVHGKIAPPLRDRFGIHHSMSFYSDQELFAIIETNSAKLQLNIQDSECLMYLANKSRGTPRIANRLLKRVRDFAQVENNNIVDMACVQNTLTIEGIDENGFNKMDRRYIYILFKIFNGGPTGLHAVACSMGEDVTTVESVIEPYLIRKEFVARTKQGRVLTSKGMEYILQSFKNSKKK